MYCKKCGFISRGIEEKCMYCGTPYLPEKKYDHKIMFMGWLESSPRQIVKMLTYNLVFIACIVEFILNLGYGIKNIHVAPWTYAGLMGALFIVNDILFRSHRPKMYFLKSFGFYVTFALLSILSYGNMTVGGHDLLFWCFGIVSPSYIIAVYVISAIYFIVKKKYNLWSTFFYMLLLSALSIMLFVFTLCNVCGIKNSDAASIINYVSFISTIIAILNGFMLSYFQIKSKML